MLLLACPVAPPAFADEEDRSRLETELEPEANLIAFSIDVAGYCIKTHRERAMEPLTDSLAPYLLDYLEDATPFQQPMRSAAICLCDDVLEHCGEAAHGIMPRFMPSALASLESDDIFQVQCAAYGLGVAGAFGGDGFLPFVTSSLAGLYKLVMRKRARGAEFAFSTENAVSALYKIARARRGVAGVDEDAIMNGVLAFLPFKADDVEARLMHGWLIDGIIGHDDLWLGKDGSRVGAAIRALADALIVHKENMSGEGKEEAAGGAGDDDDDEDDDGDESSAMIDGKHVTAIANWLTNIAADTALAPFVAEACKTLKPAQLAILHMAGLPSA